MKKRRGQRRSRFDDDDVYAGPDTYQERPRQSFQRTPREDATPAGPAIDATVKRFNPEKGYGFVELGDGSGDAFLHIALLRGAGHETVLPETKLRVQVGRAPRPRAIALLCAISAAIT
jgi:CspA family cold shock protein